MKNLILTIFLLILVSTALPAQQERPRRVEVQPISPTVQDEDYAFFTIHALKEDTLTKIAARYNISLEKLVRANGIDANEILSEEQEIKFYESELKNFRYVSQSKNPNRSKFQTSKRPARKTRSTKKSGRTYINVDGERVRSPVKSKSTPAGATAQCNDGSYSFSRHARGTCSHHGGVARWL